LIAGVWYLAGDSYFTAQAAQAVLDGFIGCVSLFVLFAAFGKIRAGLLAALGYALAPPLVIQSVLVLPDSLAAAAGVLVLACIAVGFSTGRPVVGCAAAGLVLGSSSWLRGDALALLPFLALAITAYVWQVRRQVSQAQTLVAQMTPVGALVLAFVAPVILLGLFYNHVYGEFHLSRPGVGILLWEAIGQQDNPWGIEAPPGLNLDAAAQELVQARGLAYGTWEADAFLRDEALAHMRVDPAWFVLPTLKRAVRIATLQKPPEAESNLPGVVLTSTRLAGPLLVPLALLGLYLLRDVPLLRNLLLATLLARILPFMFLRDELRFEILVVAVYVALIAVVVDSGWRYFETRRRRLAPVRA
jgi:hypothetical protein